MSMELETINKIYLELSQVATAKTRREVELEELLRSACAIAERKGERTHWDRFLASAKQVGVNGITARTYRMLDRESPMPPFPIVNGLPISRAQIIEGLREGYADFLAAERRRDPTLKGFPDYEAILDYIETHGLPPKYP
jgi:hypothetical protein